jgi:hypothetical protein
MKKLISVFALVVTITSSLVAQSVLKLDPDGLYKADKKLTPEDWSGFYISSNNKDILMIIPDGAGGIIGLYTNDYYGKWIKREGFTGDIRIMDKHGKMTNKSGVLVGELKGKLDGNGVHFLWKETVIGEFSEEQDSGFMVMKDNKEDVFAKVGGENMNGVHVFGLKNTLIYSMVKKRPIDLEKNTASKDKWLGDWNLDVSSKSILKLEDFGNGLWGYYTLKGYKSTYQTMTTIVRETIPDQTVLMLCFTVGNKLYYLSNNYAKSIISTGVIELSPDTQSFTGQEVRWDTFGVKWKQGFAGKR